MKKKRELTADQLEYRRRFPTYESAKVPLALVLTGKPLFELVKLGWISAKEADEFVNRGGYDPNSVQGKT